MFRATHAGRGFAGVQPNLARALAWIAAAATLAVASSAPAQVLPISFQPAAHSPTLIVVGFVGGFVHENDDRHPEVQMIQRLSGANADDVRAATFENRNRKEARKEIVRWLDTNGDGQLSDGEKQSARIILLGHSWGGSAVIRLANELNKRGIPVLMTIQLDSINKGPGDDCVIPSNVEQAVNFYQTHGLAHGCQALHPVDARRTRILGNYRYEYAAQPSGCRSYSWFNRHVLKTHNAMDCDTQVWALVEEQIRTQMQVATSAPDAARLPTAR